MTPNATIFVSLKDVTLSRYSPGLLNDHPVKVWGLIPINFRLEDS